MCIKIEGGLIITPGKKSRVMDVFIEDGRITEINERINIEGDKKIDARGCGVIPGFVNTHTHAAMILLRGFADDMPLMNWLQQKIWPVEANLTPNDIYWGTRMACLEMIRTGTTTFCDMYFNAEKIAEAVNDSGMRSVIASAFFDFMDKERLESEIKKVEYEVKSLINKYDVKKITPAIGPHAPYTVSIEGLETAAEMSERYNIPLHIHLAETEKEVKEFKEKHGKGIVKVLDEINFLSERLTCAHSVHLTDDEIKIMAEKKTSVSYNPVSNMKLGVGGVMPYPTMKKHNLNVSLGTDGCASNNNLNMMECMKFASLLQKIHWNSQTILPAEECFAIATVDGAKALGMSCGEIEVGRLADIVIIDLNNHEFVPGFNTLSDIVYSSTAKSIKTVIIDGFIVMEDGNIPWEHEVITKAKECAFNLVKRTLEK